MHAGAGARAAGGARPRAGCHAAAKPLLGARLALLSGVERTMDHRACIVVSLQEEADQQNYSCCSLWTPGHLSPPCFSALSSALCVAGVQTRAQNESILTPAVMPSPVCIPAITWSMNATVFGTSAHSHARPCRRPSSRQWATQTSPWATQTSRRRRRCIRRRATLRDPRKTTTQAFSRWGARAACGWGNQADLLPMQNLRDNLLPRERKVPICEAAVSKTVRGGGGVQTFHGRSLGMMMVIIGLKRIQAAHHDNSPASKS